MKVDSMANVLKALMEPDAYIVTRKTEAPAFLPPTIAETIITFTMGWTIVANPHLVIFDDRISEEPTIKPTLLPSRRFAELIENKYIEIKKITKLFDGSYRLKFGITTAGANAARSEEKEKEENSGT